MACRANAMVFNSVLIGLTCLNFASVIFGWALGMRSISGDQVFQVVNPYLASMPMLCSAVIVLILYGVGGALAHGKAFGWAFWQPFRGGVRFVAFQTATWLLLSVSLFVPFLPWIVEFGASTLFQTCNITFQATSSPQAAGALIISGSAISLVTGLFTLISLFVFERPQQDFSWEMMRLSGERPGVRAVAILFIILNISIAFGAMLMAYVTQEMVQDTLVAFVVLNIFLWVLVSSVAVTVGIGGQWLHRERGWAAWQPGRGGLKFVVLQAIGWTMFAIVIAVTILRIVEIVLPERFVFMNAYYGLMLIQIDSLLPRGAIFVGIFGVTAELILAISLLLFQEDEFQKARRFYREGRKRQREAWLTCHTGLDASVKALIMKYI